MFVIKKLYGKIDPTIFEGVFMFNKAVVSYLYCFWQVTQTRNFTRAAEVLLVSQSAVSYQIKQLEEQLGLVLFERDNRSEIRLTPNGKLLSDQCQDMFHDLKLTIDAMKGNSLTGEIVIAAPTCFGSIILSEVITQLRISHPKMKVHLRLSDMHIDLKAEQIDFAFRTVSSGVGLYTQPLIKIPMRLVASKEYAERNGLPETLDDLHDHTMILTNPRDRDWHSLKEHIPEVPVLNENVTYIDNVWGILHAVKAGMGLSYLPLYVVNDHLQKVEFVEVLPNTFKNLYMIIYTSSPYKNDSNPKVTAVMEALKSLLDDQPFYDEFYWLKAIKDVPKSFR